MYRRPFLVLPGGVCVPLEGEFRVEELRGEWYVLGHHSVTRCDSQREAVAKLAQLTGTDEADLLAGLAIESVLDGEFDAPFDAASGVARDSGLDPALGAAFDPSPEIDFAFDGEIGTPRDPDENPRLS